MLQPTQQVSQALGVIAAAAWETIIDDIRLDDDPTSYNSAEVDTTGWSALWALFDIDSTLAPTNLRFIAQWSHDGGTTWWDFEEGLWASLVWEDTDTASGVNKAFLLPCGGIDLVRIQAVATGTDATNYFQISVLVRPFRGNFEAAHA